MFQTMKVSGFLGEKGGKLFVFILGCWNIHSCSLSVEVPEKRSISFLVTVEILYLHSCNTQASVCVLCL